MKRGPREEFHPNSKLSLPVAFKIYSEMAEGAKTMELARKYNISRWVIHKMRIGTHWTYKYWRSH